MTKELKKFEKQEHPLITVAPPEKKRRLLRIPIIAIQGGALFLCLLIAVMLGSFWHYQQTTQRAASEKITALELMEQNNDTQGKEIAQLAKTTTSLETDLKRLNALNAEIRQIINNEEAITPPQAGAVRPSVTYKGQGGPYVQSDLSNLSDISKLANELQSEVKIREQSLAQLKQDVVARQVKLASTPSIWPANGDVTSPFGWRNSPWGIGSDSHPGIDIANTTGTPIFATADGVVVRAEFSGGYGNLVQIDHGNAISTLYGHNSQIIVHSGQLVKKGQVISYLGSTGNSTGPHVHYEVRVNDIAVNPESFLVLK